MQWGCSQWQNPQAKSEDGTEIWSFLLPLAPFIPIQPFLWTSNTLCLSINFASYAYNPLQVLTKLPFPLVSLALNLLMDNDCPSIGSFALLSSLDWSVAVWSACHLLLLVSWLAYSLILMMEAIYSSETLGSGQTTQHYNLECLSLHSLYHVNWTMLSFNNSIITSMLKYSVQSTMLFSNSLHNSPIKSCTFFHDLSPYKT